jgi:hypothetical protein
MRVSRGIKMPTHPPDLDPIVAKIIEALAGIMADNDTNNKWRRLVEFKDGCRYGKFGKTKAYELIAQGRNRIVIYRLEMAPFFERRFSSVPVNVPSV